MHRAASLRPGEHALGVEPVPEPGHVLRLVAELVQCLVPRRQDFPGRRVEVVRCVLVPHGQLVAAVSDGAGVGPPDLVVGGGQDAADLGPGDGAAQGDVDVRGEPFLRFDGGEVLHVVAEVAAQTSDAVKLSSCLGKFFRSGGEGGGLVILAAGGQAVPEAAEQAAEQVALGAGVPVAVGAAAVVVGAGAG